MNHRPHHRSDGTLPQHGADVRWIAARYPDAPAPLLDLSTGINPYAYPLPEFDPALVARLPDPQEIHAVKQAVLRHAGSVQRVVLSGGMQPLIFALAMRKKNLRVSIPSPTYAEHARVWGGANHEVVGKFDASAEVIVLVNPNNPDGKRYEVAQILSELQDDQLLIVDESFVELAPEISVASLAHPQLVVLRSVGKFFGLAGLRASYALCAPEIARWLELAVGPWPLSTQACELLPAMLGDVTWQQQMRAQLASEAHIFRELLAAHFTILGHTDLFTLAESPEAAAIAEALAANGIAVRRFDDYPHRLRFGLPHAQHVARINTALGS